MQFTLEKCTTENLAELIELSRTTFYEAFAAKNTEIALTSYMTKAFSHQQLKSELENFESSFYFAFFGGELAGYFKVNTGNAQAETFKERTIELARIYVIKEFRNLKIGEQMLAEAIQLGKEMFADFIWLGVWDRNPDAIRFYERNGFVKFGQHPFFMGEEEQTDLLYRLFLKTV